MTDSKAKLKPGAGPLAGVRVLDVTQALAGPYCTMLLADLGADVIKVEPPRGDMTRFAGPFSPEQKDYDYGGYFASVNRNKRSLVLDLKQDEDRKAFLALIPTTAVVVENSRTGVMERLGVGYETLAAINPKLVYAAIRGFGDPRTGVSPYADWPAYDVVAQAMGGLVSVTGLADGTVIKCGPSVADIFSGTLATVGLLAAILHARETGRGQFVDVAMYDAILSMCEGAAYWYSYHGVVNRPTGNGHPMIAPFDIYPTKDGNCAIAIATEDHWKLLCQLMGKPEVGSDTRFGSNIMRLGNRAALNEIVLEWTRAHTTEEIVKALAGKISVGPVNDMAAIYKDPHVAARDMLVEVEQPDGTRPVMLAGEPIKMSATPTGIYRRPPKLGEHTAEILAEVGITRK
ncbi:MAG TPA: CoA transferase [Candidatus Binataceae bacterium]|nr:CoA transferase [Candidatus Binataceae bacterium]